MFLKRTNPASITITLSPNGILPSVTNESEATCLGAGLRPASLSTALFSERWYGLPLPRPSEKTRNACVRDLLAFLGYLELCVHIFRRDLSAPEKHESGEFSVLWNPVGVPHSTPLSELLL